MYRSCLYCARDLGENRLLETLPIGRRVAFDSGKGRLWVVCPTCVKWNLVPFDTRLESIDACERIFRATRTRYSTDNIGLARHVEGFELIRIGSALRPEFAAWRYGDTVRRRPSRLRFRADGIGALNWILTVVSTAALDSLPMRDVTQGAVRAMFQHCVLRDPWTDQLVEVPYAALMQASLAVDAAGRWCLELPYRTGVERSLWVDGGGLPSIHDVPTLGLFTDAALLPTLGRLLPALNAGAARSTQVAEAVRLVDTVADTDRLLEYVVGRPLRFATERRFAVRDVAIEVRLALEMAAHEDTERRALEGELKLLERQWRDAEQVAAIADRLHIEAIGG
jgi:hypothetical protein